MQLPASGIWRAPLDFWIKIEKRIQAVFQLFFDFLFRAFKNMHGHAGATSIVELEGRVANFRDFFCGQEPQSVNECQISHIQF